MPKPPSSPTSDLRAVARLATDATTGLTDLVEAMHERIARLPGVSAPQDGRGPGRTSGITGLVYRTVRGVTRLAGGSIDALLGLLSPALIEDGAQAAPRPQREAIVAALNGVLGDYLVASGNPLAIPMAVRHAGRALPLERAALAQALPQAGGKLVLLLHGLCMNDWLWQRAGHDHGQALARDLGYTPLYLHYNSGQHVSLNGRALAQLLERLLAQWPQPVQRVVLLCHSMGGLVARSALHYGAQAGMAWPARVDDLVFLGTPHHGAPLERAGHWINNVLGATLYAAPFARLGRLRSAGITDLRYGNVLDEDWVGRARFAAGVDRRQPLPLPSGPRCYALAASTGESADDWSARLLGDGLVPLDSALGRHADAARSLAFVPERTWVGYGLNHLELLNAPPVYAQLRAWLA